MLATFLHCLTQISSTIYGGTVVTFAVLLAVYPSRAGRPRTEIARVWRSVGPILGLSMGAWVLGMVAGRYAQHGRIAWAWATPEQQLDLAFWLVFGVLWFSSFVLEIWTMDPLRAQVDDSNQVKDQAKFDAGYAATRAHLAFNAALVLVWQTLYVLWR